MERRRVPNATVRSVVDGYWCLRILANTWAKAGSFLVPSKKVENKQVLFFALENGLDYADFTLRKVTKHAIDYDQALPKVRSQGQVYAHGDEQAGLEGLARRRSPHRGH